MQFLADLIVELFLAIITFFTEKLTRRFPVLGKILFVLSIILLLGCAATSFWGGYATGASGDDSAQSVSPFLYCFGGLIVLFTAGLILKRLASNRVYRLIAAIALTISSAVLAGVSIWCFVWKIYTSGSMIIAIVIVCGVYAALHIKGYLKAKYGE